MVKRMVFFLSCIMSFACAMDVAEDGFSQLPNRLRRLCIFPILQSQSSMHEARNLLCSVALISKKSFEQVNCPFFVRDTIKLLVEKYKAQDKVIAHQLRIPAAMQYDRMCDVMYALATDRTLPYNACRAISSLINKGAWLNAHYGSYRVSLLAQAVQTAHVSFVSFLIKKGADVNACNAIGQHVRDCNAIYDNKKIIPIMGELIEKMWAVESHNRAFPDEYRCVAHMVSLKREAGILKNALAIDALLESCGAKSYVEQAQHPLLNMLSSEAILVRLFKYLYSDNHKNKSLALLLPQNVQRCLGWNDPSHL